MSERTHRSGSRNVSWLAAALLVLGLVSVAAAAPDLRLEAEEFEVYGWDNVGGSDIAVAYCSYASGFLAVDGLDFPGDWIKLKVTFATSGCYTSRIDYQSAYGDVVVLAVKILDCPAPGEELRSDYILNEGMGYG